MTPSDYSLLDFAKALLYNVFAFDDQHPLLFTQFYFWAFFAFVVLVLALIGRSRIMMRNAFLFFVSVFFYYKTSGDFTVLLIVATCLSYFVGMRVGKSVAGLPKDAPAPMVAKVWVGVGVVINLVVLG